MAEVRSQPMGSRRGALVLWFAAVGGPIGWFVQLIAAWSIDEVVCSAGREHVGGTHLSTVLWYVLIAPSAVVVTALVVALLVRRHLNRIRAAAGEAGAADVPLNRARTMAFVAIFVDMLFLVIVVLDGVNLTVFAPCVT